MSEILIVGSGDHARVIADLALAGGHTVAGHVDPSSSSSGSGVPIIGVLDGDLGWLGQHRDAAFTVAIGSNDVRRGAYERCLELGLQPISLVHPTAVVLGGARIGPGAQVCALALVGVDAVVEEDAIVNSAATVDHDVVVGPHAFIAPGAHLAGRVRVGAGAHVGIGAAVREGTIIGDGALVAAGAAVVADVPRHARVAGVPARPLDEPSSEREA